MVGLFCPISLTHLALGIRLSNALKPSRQARQALGLSAWSVSSLRFAHVSANASATATDNASIVIRTIVRGIRYNEVVKGAPWTQRGMA